MTWNSTSARFWRLAVATVWIFIGGSAVANDSKVHRLEIILPAEAVSQYESFDGGQIKRWNRNKKFKFMDARVSFNGADAVSAKLEFRGQTCESARRPCLGLELKDRAKLGSVKGKKFNLNSMIGDKGYINNKIGFGLIDKLGLIAIPNEYVEVSMRDAANTRRFPMGLYLIMSKPSEFAVKELGAEFLARKRYKYVESKTVGNQGSVSVADYEKSINEVYRATAAQDWKGQELLSNLEQVLDLDSYLRWLALNSLLRNGDYSDELFLVGASKNGAPYFKILPWDYDDLFGSIHHIPFYTTSCRKFKWAPIHNCESPLDRALVSDKVAYKKLLQVFQKTLLYDLPKSLTDAHLDAVAYELYPYLLLPEVSQVAKRDGRSLVYDWTSIHSLIQSRKSLINDRRTVLLRQIESELERLTDGQSSRN